LVTARSAAAPGGCTDSPASRSVRPGDRSRRIPVDSRQTATPRTTTTTPSRTSSRSRTPSTSFPIGRHATAADEEAREVHITYRVTGVSLPDTGRDDPHRRHQSAQRGEVIPLPGGLPGRPALSASARLRTPDGCRFSVNLCRFIGVGTRAGLTPRQLEATGALTDRSSHTPTQAPTIQSRRQVKGRDFPTPLLSQPMPPALPGMTGPVDTPCEPACRPA